MESMESTALRTSAVARTTTPVVAAVVAASIPSRRGGVRMMRGVRVAASKLVFFPNSPRSPSCHPWSLIINDASLDSDVHHTQCSRCQIETFKRDVRQQIVLQSSHSHSHSPQEDRHRLVLQLERSQRVQDLPGVVVRRGDSCNHPPPPCKTHTVHIWRILQGGARVCRHPSLQDTHSACVTYLTEEGLRMCVPAK